MGRFKRGRVLGLSLGMLIGVGAAAAGDVALTGNETVTRLSGSEGSRFELTYNAAGTPGLEDRIGLSHIRFGERSDAPCFFVAAVRELNAPSQAPNQAARDLCGGKDGVNNGTILEVGFPGQNDTYITGLRVCLNNGNDRVKGIEVRGKIVRDEGSLVDDPNWRRRARPNCPNDGWKRWTDCPDGQVAVGLSIAFDGGNNPRSGKGIALVCRRVIAVQEAENRGPEFTGSISVTPRAGINANRVVDLKAGSANDFTLEKIEWAEKNDDPCWLRVEGGSLAANPQRQRTTHNDCGGDHGSSDRSVGNTDGYPIFGIRVCLKNDKVKGIGIERAHFGTENGRLVPILHDRLSARQPNCDENDRDWSQYTRCPEGQIAVGLRAFFQTGDTPRDLRGLALICRAIR